MLEPFHFKPKPLPVPEFRLSERNDIVRFPPTNSGCQCFNGTAKKRTFLFGHVCCESPGRPSDIRSPGRFRSKTFDLFMRNSFLSKFEVDFRNPIKLESSNLERAILTSPKTV